PTTVYLGFQADFSNSNTANIRVRAVKLLYYGEITYAKLQALISSVEQQIADVIVNENTGYFSQQAYDHLAAVIANAKAVAEDADYDTVSEAYNALSEALADCQLYTLTGVRLQQPPHHGFYIVRQGTKTRKLFVK
ncbi:MAG: hypothetical protein ACSW8D_16980, partial [Prevotella sp.]